MRRHWRRTSSFASSRPSPHIIIRVFRALERAETKKTHYIINRVYVVARYYKFGRAFILQRRRRGAFANALRNSDRSAAAPGASETIVLASQFVTCNLARSCKRRVSDNSWIPPCDNNYSIARPRLPAKVCLNTTGKHVYATNFLRFLLLSDAL